MRLLARCDVHLSGIPAKLKRNRATHEVRCRYTSAAGRQGKLFLEKIVNRADLPNIDFFVICYDDTAFDEEIFSGVQTVRDQGMKWELMKKYVTPEYCAEYDYVFIRHDDIDLLNLAFARFIAAMQRHSLECAQPALSPDSCAHVGLTRMRSGSTGRFTDYVENMVPVLTRHAWCSYWNALEDGKSRWGWQHSANSRSACG